MMENSEKTQTLPGVMATIASGFDLVTKHLWLLVLPLLLDLFLWLGPRLSWQGLMVELTAVWQQFEQLGDVSAMTELVLSAPLVNNLFTQLSIPLVGLPVLMANLVPDSTPLMTSLIELDNLALVFLALLLVGVAGLLLSTCYFVFIGTAIRAEHDGTVPLPQQIITVWLKLFLVALLLLVATFIIIGPLAVMSAVLLLIGGTGLSTLVIALGQLLILWMVIFLAFVPQSYVLHERPFLAGVWESMRMVRRWLWPTMMLLAAVYLFGTLLDFLLVTAEDGSWLTLGWIVGHAFISTSLVTALFIFYRDRYAVMFPQN